MAEPVTPLQLRAIQALWGKKMRLAGVEPGSDESREMRHQYIRAATKGRATETKELSRADARKLIEQLAARVGQDPRKPLRKNDWNAAQHAGLDGRRDFDDGSDPMLVGDDDRELLRRLQAALGWDQHRLDAFIARQLGGRPLRTVADLNRVVWPMKRMLRSKDAPAVH